MRFPRQVRSSISNQPFGFDSSYESCSWGKPPFGFNSLLKSGNPFGSCSWGRPPRPHYLTTATVSQDRTFALCSSRGTPKGFVSCFKSVKPPNALTHRPTQLFHRQQSKTAKLRFSGGLKPKCSDGNRATQPTTQPSASCPLPSALLAERDKTPHFPLLLWA